VAYRKGAGPESAATDLEARKNVGNDNARSSKPQPQNPQAAPKSWRAVLPVHPAADLFPLMAPDELKGLGDDIKKSKLREPITLWFPDPESNKPELLDGRNRADAMEAVGLSVVRDDWKGGGIHQLLVVWRGLYAPADPYAYVISANIHRRHLTSEQKRELIAKLIKAEPTKSNRQIAKTVKASHPHVAKVRQQLEKTGDVETVTTSVDTKGRKQPARKRPARPHVETIDASDAVLADTAAAKTQPAAAKQADAASNSEIARKDARIEELQAEKRRLEIENVGLRSEVEEAKATRKPKLASDGLATLYCSFCGKSQYKVETLITDGGRKPVCICNECVDLAVDIVKKQKMAAAASETKKSDADDDLDIPPFLRRVAP
jgi:ClpX C4-type zinc finger